jgi:hypothetical protein
MAPECKLVSLKVLDDTGAASEQLIAAIAQIQEINGYGRRILIHGVNMSVGYDFEPEWFACGRARCASRSTGSSSRACRRRRGGQHRYGVANASARRRCAAGST